MGLSIHAVLLGFRRFLLALLTVCYITSCARTSENPSTFSAGNDLDHRSSEEIAPIEGSLTTQSLTLSKVVSIAYANNPTFAEFEANRATAQAEVLQALAYPNPELEVGLGFAQTRETPRESGAEYQIGVIQPIELPGKRRTRRLAAQAGIPVAEGETDVFKAILRADVAKAYYRVIYESEAIKLAESQKRLLDEFQQIVQMQIEGGESAESDLIKTRVEAIKAHRQIQFHRRQLTASRIALDALCGGALPHNYELLDSLSMSPPPVRFEDAYHHALLNHPRILRLEAEKSQREAVIAREQAAWWPDLKPGISAGRELDQDAVQISLGLEIPLWGRNQGGVATARAELSKTEAALNTARHEIEYDLRTALGDYESAREQQAAFEGGLREAATESLKVEVVLYQQGETDLWRLLDARRTAQEAEAEYLQVLYDATAARAELERNIGLVEPEILPLTHSDKGANP